MDIWVGENQMISFCCSFYPWYRDHERTREVFDVLIHGLNKINGIEKLELCIVNAGVMDVWRRAEYLNPRMFNSYLFIEEIVSTFKGKLKYLLDEGSIHRDEKNIPRFWTAKAIQTAVNMSSNDYILITGIDCYLTYNFVSDFFKRVKKGQSWVILPTALDDLSDIERVESNKIARSYYYARGIVGIFKKDYYDIGGYNCNYIKNRSDSDFYDRMESSDITILEECFNAVYHVWHPGSNMSKAKDI